MTLPKTDTAAVGVVEPVITGLTSLPPQGFDATRIWCAIVKLGGDLLAWMQTLALHDHPATIARTGRRIKLHLKNTALFAALAATGWTRLATHAPP